MQTKGGMHAMRQQACTACACVQEWCMTRTGGCGEYIGRLCVLWMHENMLSRATCKAAGESVMSSWHSRERLSMQRSCVRERHSARSGGCGGSVGRLCVLWMHEIMLSQATCKAAGESVMSSWHLLALERACVKSEFVCAGAVFEADVQQEGRRRKAASIVVAPVHAQLVGVHGRSQKCDQKSDSRECSFMAETAAAVHAYCIVLYYKRP